MEKLNWSIFLEKNVPYIWWVSICFNLSLCLSHFLSFSLTPSLRTAHVPITGTALLVVEMDESGSGALRSQLGVRSSEWLGEGSPVLWTWWAQGPAEGVPRQTEPWSDPEVWGVLTESMRKGGRFYETELIRGPNPEQGCSQKDTPHRWGWPGRWGHLSPLIHAGELCFHPGGWTPIESFFLLFYFIFLWNMHNM